MSSSKNTTLPSLLPRHLVYSYLPQQISIRRTRVKRRERYRKKIVSSLYIDVFITSTPCLSSRSLQYGEYVFYEFCASGEQIMAVVGEVLLDPSYLFSPLGLYKALSSLPSLFTYLRDRSLIYYSPLVSSSSPSASSAKQRLVVTDSLLDVWIGRSSLILILVFVLFLQPYC